MMQVIVADDEGRSDGKAAAFNDGMNSIILSGNEPMAAFRERAASIAFL